MNLREKVKSRGYWEVVIRPTKFVEQRVSNADELREIVRTHRVGILGRDFPLVVGDPAWVTDHIEQEIDSLFYVETWRLYLSGQFIYLGGLAMDWDEQNRPSGSHVRWVQRPGQILGVADTIRILTQVFEFAARLGMSRIGGERMHVATTIHGLAGRRLHMEMKGRSLSPRPPVDGPVTLAKEGEFSRQQLAAEAKSLPLGWAQAVFRRFGWDAPLQFLGEIQGDLR